MTGPDLKDAREAANLKQRDVAAEVGVSRQTIVAWETRAAIKPRNAARYLRAIEVLKGG